jgi:ribonuclease HI
MIARRTRVFFDGGARPNPGRMEAAVVVRGVAHLFEDLGTGSNTDAEWLALHRALELVQSQGIADAELLGDARGVIRQANLALAGTLPAQDHSGALPAQDHSGTLPAQDHAATFLRLAMLARPVRIRWIRRAQNLAGIALAARHPR